MSAPDFLARHVVLLQRNLQRLTGRTLYDATLSPSQALEWLDVAPFGLVSHGAEADPVFNYANHTALQLFGMTWEAFTRMPSRLSAGPVEREARARLLERVSRDGFIDDYAGIRVAADGRRFMIEQAMVWDLQDDSGQPYGQAAWIPRWHVLPDA